MAGEKQAIAVLSTGGPYREELLLLLEMRLEMLGAEADGAALVQFYTLPQTLFLYGSKHQASISNYGPFDAAILHRPVRQAQRAAISRSLLCAA